MQINRSRSSRFLHLENFLSRITKPSVHSLNRSFLRANAFPPPPSLPRFLLLFFFPLPRSHPPFLSFPCPCGNPAANKRVTPRPFARGTRAGTARVAVFIKSHGTNEDGKLDSVAKKPKRQKGGKKEEGAKETYRRAERSVPLFRFLIPREYAGARRLIPALSTKKQPESPFDRSVPENSCRNDNLAPSYSTSSNVIIQSVISQFCGLRKGVEKGGGWARLVLTKVSRRNKEDDF